MSYTKVIYMRRLRAIKNMDDDLWHRFKDYCKKQGKNIGEMLEDMMIERLK